MSPLIHVTYVATSVPNCIYLRGQSPVYVNTGSPHLLSLDHPRSNLTLICGLIQIWVLNVCSTSGPSLCHNPFLVQSHLCACDVRCLDVPVTGLPHFTSQSQDLSNPAAISSFFFFARGDNDTRVARECLFCSEVEEGSAAESAEGGRVLESSFI